MESFDRFHSWCSSSSKHLRRIAVYLSPREKISQIDKIVFMKACTTTISNSPCVTTRDGFFLHVVVFRLLVMIRPDEASTLSVEDYLIKCYSDYARFLSRCLLIDRVPLSRIQHLLSYLVII